MAHITADRVRDTTTTTGTGALTVSGTAPSYGYRTFSAVCATNDTFWYCVAHQSSNEWETGLGTYSSSNTITRTTVIASSNSNSAVSFSAGTKDVFITLAASKTVQFDNAGNASVTGTLAMGSSFLRNRLINGGMSVDQRNAGASKTFTAAANLDYGVDRWFVYCTGANVTGQRIAGTAPSQYAYRLTGATSNTLAAIGQRIESLNAFDLASGDVTISVYMTASTAKTITWYLYSPTTADTWNATSSTSSPQVYTQISTGTLSVTTTRNLFTITIPAATMSGYNKGLELLFTCPSLTSGVTWTVEQAQLEAGTINTAFEQRLFAAELAMCQRYFETSFYHADTYAAVSTIYLASSSHYCYWHFKAQKRAVPSIGFVTGAWGVTPTVYPALYACEFFNGASFYATGVSGAAALYADAEL